MGKAWRHCLTITRHRHEVMRGCFRVGLYWRGLVHDLSKYSPTEFRMGARYFTGTHSPNVEERLEHGYSLAWMHHKGRNRHHFEYWTDIDLNLHKYVPVPMPTKFLVEMIMDRIAACKIYHGKNYRDGDALEYLLRSREGDSVHPETLRKTVFLLTMLRDRSEKETFDFIKNVVLKELPFAEDSDAE